MSVRSGSQFVVSRGLTAVYYLFGIIGTTGWDDTSNSWRLIAFRLIATVTFFWIAVARTVRHVSEDKENDEGSDK